MTLKLLNPFTDFCLGNPFFPHITVSVDCSPSVCVSDGTQARILLRVIVYALGLFLFSQPLCVRARRSVYLMNLLVHMCRVSFEVLTQHEYISCFSALFKLGYGDFIIIKWTIPANPRRFAARPSETAVKLYPKLLL